MNPDSPLRFDTPTGPSYDYSDWSGVIAVTAGPHHIRVAHTVSKTVLFKWIDATPVQIRKVLNFVRTTKRDFPAAKLIGDRHERWPHGLYASLVQEFGPISWVSDTLLKRAAADYRRSTQVLKFARATFLAACAAKDTRYPGANIGDLLASWKKDLLTEIAYHLDLGPEPDIPF